MAHVTLSEVIRRRVPLTAREAVTLTLAVAKEWDGHALPDPSAIHLCESGDVSFLVTPGTSKGETLSSLLGQLLGTDEIDGPHPTVRSAIASGVSAPAIPAVPDESFRSALLRFADDDYARIVADVVRRTTAAPDPTIDAAAARPRHAGPERRRQPRIVAELRLDIRELERELFALRTRSKPPTALSRSARRRIPLRLVLAGAAACVLALLTFIAVELNPMRAAAGAAGALPGGIDQSASRLTPLPSTAPVASTPDSNVTSEVAHASAAPPARPSIGAQRKLVRHRQATPSPRAKQPAPTFAGGARSITWLRQ